VTTMNQGALELKFLSYDAEDAAVALIVQLSNSIFCPVCEEECHPLRNWRLIISGRCWGIVWLWCEVDDARSGVRVSFSTPPTTRSETPTFGLRGVGIHGFRVDVARKSLKGCEKEPGTYGSW